MPRLSVLEAELRRREQEALFAREGATRAELIEESKDRCRTFRGFIREAWHVLEPSTPFVHGWHIDAIADHCEAISRGHILRLQINEPPGCMKSLEASVFWPAFEWGPLGRPDLRYLSTSYLDTYARRDSRKMRDLVLSEWFQERWPITLTRDGEADFENTMRGGRRAMPFASLTAGRGNRVIVDDPHSTETAESEADRERARRIFRESVTSRLNDPVSDAILVIMHRLHQKDLCGVIEELGLDYVKLVLPMEFEPKRQCVTPIFTDPRTYDGELLFPERFTRETLDRDKKALGSYAYAGQYQQRPAPREGGMFKRHWFGVVGQPPAGTKWVRGWDLAASTGTQSAFTAGVKLGKAPDKVFYIADIARGQLEGADVRRLIVNTADLDGTDCEIALPKDPAQAGKVQAADMIAMLAGYKALAEPQTGAKETRAEPVAAQAEAGNVKLVRGSWNEAFLEEACLFPNGKFKDQVDALATAFARLIARKSFVFGAV